MLNEVASSALVLSMVAGALGLGGAARTVLTLAFMAVSLLLAVLLVLFGLFVLVPAAAL